MEKEIIDYWKNRKPFKDETDIPSLPGGDLGEIIPEIIRCGGIRKSDLVPGKEYLGSCRNSSKAIWNGTEFEYTRHKWGSTYTDTIGHFEDPSPYDLFIPIKEI